MRLYKTAVGLVILAGVYLLAGCGGGGGGDGGMMTTFSLRGTVYSAAGNRVDSDVNDEEAAYFAANDDFDTAQALSAPVVLGGYVNMPSRGAMGATFLAGDTSDFFHLTLPEGAAVRLVLPDEIDDDETVVALYLYSDGREQIDAVSSTTPVMLLTVPSSGGFFIEVRVTGGATAYQLIVDLPAAAAQSDPLLTSAEFVPAEVLVRFKPARSSSSAMADLTRRSGMQPLSHANNGWVRLRADDLPGTLRRLDLTPASDLPAAGTGDARRKAIRGDTLRLISALRARADVAEAQPNYIRRPQFVPSDPLFPLQWHLTLIHLPAAWDLTLGSEDVIVAVIDSGIIDHPDLVDHLVAGYDFISDPVNAGDDDGADPDPTDPGESIFGDTTFHGTHVAGTVSAAFDNGIGVAGVGGRTRIMPVRALGREGGWDTDIANAIRWAAGIDVTDEAGNPITGADPPADIINMSFGGPGTSVVLTEAIQEAYAAGAILVSSAGNSANTTLSYPAAYDEVVSVSAVDAQARLAFYSSYGYAIDVAAPGGDIYSDIQPDGYSDGILSTAGIDTGGTLQFLYSFASGTSMAAPQLAGVAALMKAVDPGITPDLFRAYLINGDLTDDLGPAGRDDLYGYGLVNAHKAVVAAGELAPPAVLSVTPGALRLDDQTDSAALYLSAIGQGDLVLAGFGSNVPWLTVTKPTAGDFGQYQVSVDRSQLTGGIQSGAVTFEPAEGDVLVVPVAVEVLPDMNGSAGTQYLLLVDAITLDVVQRQKLSLTMGVYPFELTGVASGEYYLVCSSDIDGDFRVTDQGEAVGGYPSIAAWRPIVVNAHLSGLDFVAGFSQFPYQLPGAATIIAP